MPPKNWLWISQSARWSWSPANLKWVHKSKSIMLIQSNAHTHTLITNCRCNNPWQRGHQEKTLALSIEQCRNSGWSSGLVTNFFATKVILFTVITSCNPAANFKYIKFFCIKKPPMPVTTPVFAALPLLPHMWSCDRLQPVPRTDKTRLVVWRGSIRGMQGMRKGGRDSILPLPPIQKCHFFHG